MLSLPGFSPNFDKGTIKKKKYSITHDKQI